MPKLKYDLSPSQKVHVACTAIEGLKRVPLGLCHSVEYVHDICADVSLKDSRDIPRMDIGFYV